MVNSLLRRAWDNLRQVNPGALVNAGIGSVEALLRRPRPWSYPWKLDIVLTKACNLNCRFCISYGSLNEDRWMDFRLYERIAHTLFPWVHSLFFCSGGEGLLYPHFREALDLARRYRTFTTLVTNGMLLNRRTADWLVASQNLHELSVSFDGARKETLEGLRRGANYELILENLAYLHDEKRRRSATFPRLSLHFVIMASNARELPELFPLAARVGVSRLWVSYLNVCNDLDPGESLYYHPQLAAEVFRESRRSAAACGISLTLPAVPGQDVNNRRCLKPWEFCLIDTDGSLRLCYYSWRQRFGFFAEDFGRLWRGELYQRLRRTLESPEPEYPYCRYCDSHRGVNWESSHFQERHAEAYVIQGLEHLQVPFQSRRDENLAARKTGTSSRQGRES